LPVTTESVQHVYTYTADGCVLQTFSKSSNAYGTPLINPVLLINDKNNEACFQQLK